MKLSSSVNLEENPYASLLEPNIESVHSVALALNAILDRGIITKAELKAADHSAIFELARRFEPRVTSNNWDNLNPEEVNRLRSFFPPENTSELSPIRG